MGGFRCQANELTKELRGDSDEEFSFKASWCSVSLKACRGPGSLSGLFESFRISKTGSVSKP